ncbi:BTB/POZ domain containing protein [Histomonas meleagridis]|uniref:BTB/POZ domain containing protein n=1 Tax=Histomonas meleagridis TaxID=135588 RepID=UPI0035598BBD|nr:BTB/POZ domain containing protein [Histomonas meleagridis]KAH0803014.1 BTB/POZ domain containing protein [Histomonas meleagridis]
MLEHQFHVPITFDFNKSDLFTDCTLNFGKESLRSHRILLTGCSKKFSEFFSSDEITTADLSQYSIESFRTFLVFLYTGNISLNYQNLQGIVKIACDFDINSLITTCSEFIDQICTTRSCLQLLTEIKFALSKFPNFLKYAATLIEKLSTETDFSFMTPKEFKLLISYSRFSNNYTRDDIIKRYLTATNLTSVNIDDYTTLQSDSDDSLQRTSYSAVAICSPPNDGLTQLLRNQIKVYSSGMFNGRDPTSIVQSQPKQHWFTESDGNAWVLIDFEPLYVQPTDYAIWSHGGYSTLRNFTFQASNDRKNWVVLSVHRDEKAIKEPFSTCTWPVNTNGFFRYFRIVQTGNNWSGNRWMYLMKLEIWGVACTIQKDD